MPTLNSLFPESIPDASSRTSDDILDILARFRWEGRATAVDHLGDVPVYVNEFWTSRQRAAHSLHEVSYRACFKPQLPAFSSTSSPGTATWSTTRLPAAGPP